MSILLQVEHLTVAYQALAVLRNVNLTLRHGEKVALVGANGSGKSSLLLHLSGCLTPRAGRILVEGESCIGQPRRAGAQDGITVSTPRVPTVAALAA
ncbi:Cobalt import ATP-binding protein CbiO [Edwardsiella tarda]|nr:Cobalt import ATP-binding protein CbiO [Edwardsiella tarda]